VTTGRREAVPPGDDAAGRLPRDPLTGLPSRAVFVQAVHDAARGGRPSTLLQVGVDRFRDVNEHFGPGVGDAVLVELAARLRDAAGPDVHVARLGGDEFGLLVPGPLDVAAVEGLAARVVAAAARPCPARDRDGTPVEVTVGASVGLATRAAEHAGDVGAVDLLTAGDAAMRQAKARGRGRYLWWTAPAASSSGVDPTRQVESRLRSALAAGAITLHYQPLVELPSGRVMGVEALARWDDPELGVVPPDRFVAVAERSGLIFDLGRQVLDRACREASRWRAVRDGADLLVSVNVSPLQLADADFVGDVARALQTSGMPPENLCLEITETAAIDDIEVTRSRLGDLRALGVTLALDDFGTGYSSITMLRHLPVDLVKMDRSFVAHLTSDAQDAVLARLVVDAAHAMGMQVCAEGVETVEQARQLSALGCDRAQGWYYAAAHPPGRRLDAALTLERPLLDAAHAEDAVALALTGTDELVLVTDPAGVVAFASSSAGRLLGTPPARVAGTHVLDHLQPADATAVSADGGLREGTARMRARAVPAGHDGDAARWLEVRTTTVHRHDDRPRQALSVARDVTAVVAAEEETAASERRFRHAFDDAPIGMAMTTLDGTFMRVNRSFAEMLGYRPEEVLATTVDRLTAPADRAADRANLDQVRRGEQHVHDLHKRYLHRDGHPVPARVRAAVVPGDDGGAPYILAHVLAFRST
jgi:PAS domain S-box-containing protein/diguanylate cyclase (GGDEF)-like protein